MPTITVGCNRKRDKEMKRILIVSIFYLLGTIFFFQGVMAQQIRPLSRAALDSLVYPPLMKDAEKILNFSLSIHHIGTIKETHPEITIHYPFRNVSADTVYITRVHTLCGCTQSEDFIRNLPPAAEDSITIRFLPLGKVGNVRQRVFVYTNISNQPVACLEIIGQVTEK